MCALHTEHGAARKGSQAKVLKDTVATLAAVVAGVASASLIWIGPWAHETCALAEVIIFFGLSLRTRDFRKGSVTYTSTQVPLTITYAITIHKSQGATLDQAVVDISCKDFQLGLTYVAVSRVRSLQGIMFDRQFDLDSLRSNAIAAINAREEDRLRRIPQHVPLTLYP